MGWCVFQERWKDDDKYRIWIEADPKSRSKVRTEQMIRLLFVLKSMKTGLERS